MRHIDLFSGIGGFALAAFWAWQEEYENVAHSEIEKKICRIYHKQFPESECLGDIKKTDFKRFNEAVDLVTGGFPCQPFSVAGKRKGKDDDRAIWPEMLRAIQEIRPQWVVAENVPGIIKMELENVLTDLENEGYWNYEDGKGRKKIAPFIIPACAVDMPHRRDRVWIAAYCIGKRGRKDSKSRLEMARNSLSQSRWNKNSNIPEKCNSQYSAHDTESNIISIADTESQRLEGSRQKSREQEISKGFGIEFNRWQEGWLEIATRLCRMDDGVRNRVDRLRGLGNAIVPQVAYEIFKIIREIESDTSPSKPA